MPQTRDEAAEAIFRLGAASRALQRLDADLKDALAEVKRSFEERAEPLTAETAALIEGLKVFCEANRDDLTNGGRTKTAAFTTGTVSWRLRPPAVKIRGGEEAVLTFIFNSADADLRAFVRIRHEISREAMLANPAKALELPGVAIASEGEDFAVEPFTPDGIEARRG